MNYLAKAAYMLGVYITPPSVVAYVKHQTPRPIVGNPPFTGDRHRRR